MFLCFCFWYDRIDGISMSHVVRVFLYCFITLSLFQHISEAERYPNIHLNFQKKLVSAKLQRRQLTFHEWVKNWFLIKIRMELNMRELFSNRASWMTHNKLNHVNYTNFVNLGKNSNWKWRILTFCFTVFLPPFEKSNFQWWKKRKSPNFPDMFHDQHQCQFLPH